MPAKNFELILHEQIRSQRDNQITNLQHGFRQSRGIQSNLALFVQYLSESIDRGVKVDAVYTDFQKTFDKVNHSILLQKMAALGFVSEASRFFE